jgi:hypothetical protein
MILPKMLLIAGALAAALLASPPAAAEPQRLPEKPPAATSPALRDSPSAALAARHLGGEPWFESPPIALR